MVHAWTGKICAMGLVLGAAVSSPSLADVLVSNFAEPFRGATPIGNNPNPTEPPGGGPWYWAAQSFVTDGAPYQLDWIEAIVGNGSAAPPPVVVAELRADNGRVIDALITTLTAPNVSGALIAQVFTPDAAVTLQPNTIYWVVLGSEVPGDGTFEFAYADSDNFAGPGIIGTWADTQQSGALWNYQTGFPYFLQVNVTLSTDGDFDGVYDLNDVCCNTPPGVAVDAEGRPIGDLDRDCDNDLADYALYSQGFTGPLSEPADCCPSGQASCAGTCVDTASDIANCGGCGNACPEGLACESGSCAECPGGGTLCSGVCTNVAFDTQNCGGCGIVCSGGETCSGGICQSRR